MQCHTYYCVSITYQIYLTFKIKMPYGKKVILSYCLKVIRLKLSINLKSLLSNDDTQNRTVQTELL